MLSRRNNTPETQHSYQGLFRQDGAEPEPSGIFHLQEEVASPVLSPLLSAMVLEDVIPPPDHLAAQNPLGVN